MSNGLSFSDDSELALVAKSLARGVGYSEAIFDDGSKSQFAPEITTGPTLILPCALLLKFFGANETVPGLSAILVWASVLTFPLIRTGRYTPSLSLLLGVAVFCFSILITCAFDMGQWYGLLGEVTAACLLLLGHWIIAMERLSWRWLFLSGLSLGLAIQTKNLALLGTVGGGAILIIRLKCSESRRNIWLMYSASWLLGCILPTAFFETWKLIHFGLHGYVGNWKEYISFAKAQGLSPAKLPLFDLLQLRIKAIEERFSVNLPAFAILMLLGLRIRKEWRSDQWVTLFLGLQISIGCLGFYWLFFSVGWPRYLLIAVVMGCFALSIPVFGLVKVRDRALFAALSVVFLVGGISRLPFAISRADRGLFRPTNERIARAQIVEAIRRKKQQGSITLGGTYFRDYIDVQFLLGADLKFRRVDAIDPKGSEKKIILINKHFGIPNEREYIEKTLGAPLSTILSVGPYELMEQNGSP